MMLLLWVCAAMAQANADKYKLLSSAPIKANSISVDNFGNFYAVSGNRITKFDKTGAQLQIYEEVKYGKIGSIDISNPMKIVVYYPDFMQAVLLDKFLAYFTTYNFFDLGYQNVTAVGSSSDGYLWFYDNLSYTLKKVDEAGKTQLQSQPVNQLINTVITPTFIMEKGGQVYVNDPAVGVLVFDNFGAYYKTIPIKGLDRFQIFQEQVVYFEDGKLKSYNPATFDAKMISLPDTIGIKQAVIEKERIGILRADRIDFYKY
ncbi:MAG: hypothetical protein JWO03_3648 [Bacteroidetes bacterium]|nr:hypothetical protein [Bacteroidota bacterium]